MEILLIILVKLLSVAFLLSPIKEPWTYSSYFNQAYMYLECHMTLQHIGRIGEGEVLRDHILSLSSPCIYDTTISTKNTMDANKPMHPFYIPYNISVILWSNVIE